MVCIFCIAVLAMVAGALTAASIDQAEEQLTGLATDGVRRVSDTESVARFELTMDVSGKSAPVALTLYKEHGRARIQVLTHALTPEEVQRLEDQLAEAIGAKVVEREDGRDGSKDESAHAHEEPEKVEAETAERVEAKDSTEPGRERESEPPRGDR